MGTGVGSFETAFPPYQSVPGDAVWDHAHNDYAEGLAETGIIGGAMIFGALFIFLGRAFRKLKAGARSVAGWMQLGAIIGSLGIVIHSLFDFNLHIPANAAWFAACCGIALLDVQTSREARRVRSFRAN